MVVGWTFIDCICDEWMDDGVGYETDYGFAVLLHLLDYFIAGYG